ncbi:MAG TPA: CBS domain-containing protein [Rectinemataceae bacterium]|nr:CBS domain-containing protein [Rectinemataceae bacterium]
MKIRELVNRRETIVEPLASVAAVENRLVLDSYVVIKDEGKFIGILTPADALANGHNLVVDCYTEKPMIDGNEDAEKVMNLMLKRGIFVLPVCGDDKNYLGSVHIASMLEQIWAIVRPNVNVSWVNVIDDADSELEKRSFVSELFHNTKNPLQVMLSAVNMLRAYPDGVERNLLLNTIEANVKLLDELITKLYEFHFSMAEPGAAPVSGLDGLTACLSEESSEGKAERAPEEVPVSGEGLRSPGGDPGSPA